jgi:predicted DNA-binding transcriptional regulator AlpA
MAEYISTEGLSDLINVPVPTLRQWRHRGVGPPGVRLEGHVRYRLSEVEAWIEALARNERHATSDDPQRRRPSTGGTETRRDRQ